MLDNNIKIHILEYVFMSLCCINEIGFSPIIFMILSDMMYNLNLFISAIHLNSINNYILILYLISYHLQYIQNYLLLILNYLH
jgi:hypothetical protein